MTRAEIISKVMACLDESIPEGANSIILNEPLPIYQYVDKFLDDSAKDVLLIGPIHLCTNAFSKPTIIIGTPKYIFYPDDCIRIASIICPGWEIPVTRLITPSKEPASYAMAKNKFTVGLARPFAAIVEKIVSLPVVPVTNPVTYADQVKEVIELFNPADLENGTASVAYVKAVPAEQCNSDLLPAIWLLTAAKVLSSTGRQEAKVAYELFQNALNIQG